VRSGWGAGGRRESGVALADSLPAALQNLTEFGALKTWRSFWSAPVPGAWRGDPVWLPSEGLSTWTSQAKAAEDGHKRAPVEVVLAFEVHQGNTGGCR